MFGLNADRVVRGFEQVEVVRYSLVQHVERDRAMFDAL
jgi:hypothetical protein